MTERPTNYIPAKLRKHLIVSLVLLGVRKAGDIKKAFGTRSGLQKIIGFDLKNLVEDGVLHRVQVPFNPGKFTPGYIKRWQYSYYVSFVDTLKEHCPPTYLPPDFQDTGLATAEDLAERENVEPLIDPALIQRITRVLLQWGPQLLSVDIHQRLGITVNTPEHRRVQKTLHEMSGPDGPLVRCKVPCERSDGTAVEYWQYTLNDAMPEEGE